jgi:hypothetical protein
MKIQIVLFLSSETKLEESLRNRIVKNIVLRKDEKYLTYVI